MLHKRRIVTTADGSKTIAIDAWKESYHSKHGAIQESAYVFIQNGLLLLQNRKEVTILEMGFGTGLNAILSMLFCFESKQKINYLGVEKYPISKEEFHAMDFGAKIFLAKEYNGIDKDKAQGWINAVQECVWEKQVAIHPYFSLQKIQQDFFDLTFRNQFDLVYFDCFGARVQPELWDEKLFKLVYNSMKDNGILTTYAAKGSARRAMQQVGFTVSKLPGPPGKREMMIARKIKTYG